MPDYDIVIIGSGLGGLICGNILSKEGLSVCIIEKNHQLGGCLQTFTRNNVIFDTGMHYIGSLGEGQITNKFFKYFGILDKLKLREMDENAFEIIDYQGHEYRFAMGYERFAESLIQQFPEEKEAITNYCNKLKQVVKSLKLYNLEETEMLNITDSEYIVLNTYEFICSLTSNETLRNILAGNNQLYYGDKSKTPLYIHAVLSHSLIESSWRLVDGGGQIASALAGEILKNGGTIHKRTKAERFILNDGRVESVELENGETITAKYFISNIHPSQTLKMIDPSAFKKAYRTRISDLDNTGSVFTIYAELKENSFKYLNSNMYYYKVNDVWDGLNYNDINWPGGYVLLTPATSKSDVYADSLIIMTFMKFDDVRKWEDTDVEKRGDDYLSFKASKAEQLLDLVEVKYLGIRSKIKRYHTSTPLTYRDYTATPEGSVYGVIKDCNNILKNYVSARTPLPNLLYTGQNVNMHGVTGVCIGSLQTCSEILGLNYLIRKINNVE